MSELGCADGCGRGMGAEKCADGCGRRGCREGREKKPLGMGELGCADGCGRQMGGGTAADGVGAREWLEMGWEKKPLETSELGCADGCGREMAAENWRTAADGVRATEWLEMGGEKKPLEISELGCADGCGREMGAENCADGCGRRGCNGVAGNGWGEEAAGDQQAWLRGGCGRQRVGRIARTPADGVGAREWLEMGGEKKPLEISELGCADGCGREMAAENCADGCVQGSGWKWVGRRSRW